MILYGVPSSFCLFFSYVYVIMVVVVPTIVSMHLPVLNSPVVDFLVVGFLVTDLQRSVELIVDFLG